MLLMAEKIGFLGFWKQVIIAIGYKMVYQRKDGRIMGAYYDQRMNDIFAAQERFPYWFDDPNEDQDEDEAPGCETCEEDCCLMHMCPHYIY